jgi:hypothetical protein
MTIAGKRIIFQGGPMDTTTIDGTPLAAVSLDEFNAWINKIVESEQIDDFLCRFLIAKHSESWDELARIWAVINFQVRGVDLAKYGCEQAVVA